MTNLKTVEKKIQLGNTLLVCGQDVLASFKKKKQTKKVGNLLIRQMSALGIPKEKLWIDRKQVRADLASGKIHDNTADDDFGQYDVADTKKALKDLANQYFILWEDGGADPYFEECNGVTAVPIYGDQISPERQRTTGNDCIISHYQFYLDKLNAKKHELIMEKHILQKTNDVHSYAQKLTEKKHRARAKAEQTKKHADKVSSAVNQQLRVIKKMK